MLRRLPLAVVLMAAPAFAGPLEFGLAEFDSALSARGMNRAALRVTTEINTAAPETWRIEPGRYGTLIEGGDLRGLMYGLLEAAEQIRRAGHLVSASGTPATPMRGIRKFLHAADLEKSWYDSHDYWNDFFAMLARNRFNRFNLVFAHQTNYLAPPYPFWIELKEFPGIRVPGLAEADRRRNLATLRFIAQSAADHGIDFTLGIWEHDVQPGMTPAVEGLTEGNLGPYSYAALKAVLAECPAIRGVQMRTNSESGIPSARQVEFYRDWVWKAIRDTGRRVTLDLRGWSMQQGMLDAAIGAGVPLRLSSKYWAEDLGRPYQPAETFPGYSYIDFLKKTKPGNHPPRPWEFYWELWGLGSHRLLLWGDPDYVRRAVPTFTLGESSGFEIDPPLAQKGFGNRPGEWDVFTPAGKDRIFWRWDFERYWMFYTLWGRLSYDPHASDRVWMDELQHRFGLAAAGVYEAYRWSGKVLNEIVAVHLADPNMYIWPEINPGGLIEAYRQVRPSDWRFVATVEEAVRNRARGVASAKQTPLMTAQKLHGYADEIERAVARAKPQLPASAEWRSSEPDFLVLAALARYHARKQIAADQLTWFYETGDITGLHAARRELLAALRVWENLVRLTDGLYPAEMAFGPDDAGHWKDKFPYVLHDVKLLDERIALASELGSYTMAFDFGGPLPEGRGASYRNDPWVLSNTVEPGFRPVAPDTRYTPETGYGWAEDGDRRAIGIETTPYPEVRAVAREPQHLPSDVLFRDTISGSGPQVFRVKAEAGQYSVLFLHPGRAVSTSIREARNGTLDIAFPAGEWTVAGLVIRPAGYAPNFGPEPWPAFVRRPAMHHAAPAQAPAGKPLALSLQVSPPSDAVTVRLHYRALDQTAQFKTLEAPAGKALFTIPAADLLAPHDLMYYFEILNKHGSGWFEPDPAVATPYWVVRIEP